MHDATIIDSSVLQSRIIMSDSLQMEHRSEQVLEVDSADTDNAMDQDATNNAPSLPNFPKLSAHASSNGRSEYRRIRCPPHRYTPLRENWENILTPLVDFLKLQVRFNTKTRSVELKTSPHTFDASSLQKGADFVSAFLLGFEVQDAVALLRLDDLFVESFQVTDVKLLKGDHLSRAGTYRNSYSNSVVAS
jgi:RNA-binding protein PNO1